MRKPGRYKINTTSFDYYWTKGAGLALLNKLPDALDLKKAESFVPYLFDFDQPGDELVNELHQKVGFVQAQKTVDDYFENKEGFDAHSKKILDNFFDQIKLIPDWLDQDLLQYGLDFSQRSGISGLIVLRNYCLMGGYESAAINKPLIYTGALKKGAAKRLTDTTVFWVDVTEDDALSIGKAGFRAVIKTRFIHAFSRINILKSTDWETEKWGIPLNTWDMLATNLGFSLVYMVGLQKIGIEASEKESLGLFHLWKYIGYLLGIPEHLLPNNEVEAIEALYYWTMTQSEGDEDTILLAQALQEEPIHAAYPPFKLGRSIMHELHLYYNHFLLGDYSCGLLGLKKTNLGKIAHLNIFRNRFQHYRMTTEKQRQKAIKQGRKQHEDVKRIYSTHKAK
ncbi:oxygenase MpaB family protein [Pedobacter nototheniae]|uniref:oxygenase MpaB family protein n=1 Tax=Pedobacter nototheniae TaxID=2488994 RepID=UPI00292DD240|nr:oxygenase MpaB family protein [Pedobacter nototheniae]